MAVKVHILAYHAIETGPGPLCVDPRGFAAVVETFATAGFRSLTAAELLHHVVNDRPLPPRTVVFTFDDGYASVYDQAFPVLARHGFTATVFPVTAHLGDANRWDEGRPGIPRLRLMDGSRLQELVAAGWELGGHTHTHRPLTGLDDRQIDDELNRSNEILAELTGAPIRTFAYPFGLHDPRVRRRAATAYRLAFEIGAGTFVASAPLDRAPRIEGWYVRTGTHARTLTGPFGPLYLMIRRRARTVRRLLRGGGDR